MKKLEFDGMARSVVDGLAQQILAISRAANAAADESSPLDDVYAAIEKCMQLDCGVVDMGNVYEAVLVAAVKTRADMSSLKKRREDGSWVYFMRRHDGLIKIGYSHDPKARLSQIKQQYQCDAEILAITPGARDLESRLHRKFAHCRSNGEWFHPSPELMAHISELGRYKPSLQFH